MAAGRLTRGQDRGACGGAGVGGPGAAPVSPRTKGHASGKSYGRGSVQPPPERVPPKPKGEAVLGRKPAETGSLHTTHTRAHTHACTLTHRPHTRAHVHTSPGGSLPWRLKSPLEQGLCAALGPARFRSGGARTLGRRLPPKGQRPLPPRALQGGAHQLCLKLFKAPTSTFV